MVDMPYDHHRMVVDPGTFTAKAAELEQEALVDMALWATLPPRGPLDHVAELQSAGACAFKLSTFDTDPDRFPRVPDDQLLAGFAAIAGVGGLAGVHSENDEIVRAGSPGCGERAAATLRPTPSHDPRWRRPRRSRAVWSSRGQPACGCICVT